jgi:hypothetical protein
MNEPNHGYFIKSEKSEEHLKLGAGIAQWYSA